MSKPRIEDIEFSVAAGCFRLDPEANQRSFADLCEATTTPDLQEWVPGFSIQVLRQEAQAILDYDNYDPEKHHEDMDQLMVDFINDEEFTFIWDSLHRWYS